MSVTPRQSPAVLHALRSLEQAIVPPRAGTSLGTWRFAVRQRLAAVRDALTAADVPIGVRERGILMARLNTLSSEVLERRDLEAVRAELRRLVMEVNQQTRHP